MQRLNAGGAASRPGQIGDGVEQPGRVVLRVLGRGGAEEVGADQAAGNVFAAVRQVLPQVRLVNRARAQHEGGDRDDCACDHGRKVPHDGEDSSAGAECWVLRAGAECWVLRAGC